MSKADKSQIVSKETEAKPKRGRPKGSGSGKPTVQVSTTKTKVIDGKLMKRAMGVPKKVLTGKRGRPRKQYVWVEVSQK